MNIEDIARVAHEANRAYCVGIGEIPYPVWEDAPEWQHTTVIEGVVFHQTHPGAGPAASHESWLAVKEGEGWVYGEVKDPEHREHPCMVPFNELPHEQQMKDALFIAVVYALS